MRSHSASYFCDKGKVPTCEMKASLYHHAIVLNNTELCIYVADESDLIAFKNSIAHAYKAYKEVEDEKRKSVEGTIKE